MKETNSHENTKDQIPETPPPDDDTNALPNSQPDNQSGGTVPAAATVADPPRVRARDWTVHERDQLVAEAKSRGMTRRDAKRWAYSQLGVDQPETSEESPAGQVQGLGLIPADWPSLPPNASLQAELGWVQANRLLVVNATPGGAIKVDLGAASTPAPSMAALGWLETSIRSYAKYVDVVARSLAVVQDEQEQVRRERLALEEIEQLLREMHWDEEG